MNTQEMTKEKWEYLTIRTFIEVQQNRRWILNQPKMARLPHELLLLKEFFEVLPNRQGMSLVQAKEQFKVKDAFDEEYAWFAFDFQLIEIFRAEQEPGLPCMSKGFFIPVPSKKEQKALMDYQRRGVYHPIYGKADKRTVEENTRIEERKCLRMEEWRNRKFPNGS